MHRLLTTLLAAGSLLTGFAALASAAPVTPPYSNFSSFYIGGLVGGILITLGYAHWRDGRASRLGRNTAKNRCGLAVRALVK